MEGQSEAMLLDKLASGDRPSVMTAGAVAAKALKESGMAVFMVDVLGRVHLLPSSAVQVLHRPRVEDAELNKLDEEQSIQLLLKQGDSEDVILGYLKRRDSSRQEL